MHACLGRGAGTGLSASCSRPSARCCATCCRFCAYLAASLPPPLHTPAAAECRKRHTYPPTCIYLCASTQECKFAELSVGNVQREPPRLGAGRAVWAARDRGGARRRRATGCPADASDDVVVALARQLQRAAAAATARGRAGARRRRAPSHLDSARRARRRHVSRAYA
jgi:hypothetical protein